MTRGASSTAPRMRRLAAAWLPMAPLLPPLCMLLGLAASGEARGMGGVGVLVFLYGWAALAALVTLLWLALDLVRLTRSQPTLAFVYAGLAVEGARPSRRALAAVLVVIVPPLVGWAASAGCAANASCSLELENELLWCTPIALWLINWLFWLGPSARTLADYVAGGRISLQPRDHNESTRPRPWWPDALLLMPPLLALPTAGGMGGIVGLLVAFAILAIPVWITRKSVAFTAKPGS
jgi:hypothetical protein